MYAGKGAFASQRTKSLGAQALPIRVDLARLLYQHVRPYQIKANRRQDRQLCLVDDLGFPRSKPKKKSTKHAFRTGDLVRAVVPAHLNNAGVHVGRVSVKASGALTIVTKRGTVTDIGYRYCLRLQREDGYAYTIGRKEKAASSRFFIKE